MKRINIKNLLCSILTSGFVIMTMGCGSDSNPAGPSSGSPFAYKVLGYHIMCPNVNDYTDPDESLGPPDLKAWRDPYAPQGVAYSGFVSLGVGGSISLEMGVDIIDGPGYDLKVYQAISREAVGVYVADNLSNTFAFLGSKYCDGICYFDISGSGYSKIRYVRVADKQYGSCYESAGADIDAVEAINYR